MNFNIVMGKRCIAISCLILLFLAACDGDDVNSVSATDEPVSEVSSSSSEKMSSSESRVKSSSSSARKNSSSSEKAKSSSSSLVKSSSSSSVVLSSSAKSSSSSAKSSSSNVKSSSSVRNGSSSSLVDSEGWSWDVPKDARLNPEIEYDSITDSRDGKVYKTVKIGDQTWMAENLNYDATDWNSWCFGKSNNKDSSTCDVAGRLYTWAAAIDSIKLKALKSIVCGYGRSCTLPDMVDGICPSGWHLPNNAEWKDLFSAVGDISSAGKVLKSQSGWVNKGNGSDTYGFSALPTGDRGSNGNFYNDGAIAYFWSSTTNSGTDAYTVELNNHFDRAYLRLNPKNFGFSVRCLKN